ncbi:MAG TPA: class I mannose-6-phosphate isomerase [Clostridiales bacterium]|jgi:mannose-6-phosphate isomerase|nr:class I mannose-6-phosphate isomerase [Clostridiales bacterium]
MRYPLFFYPVYKERIWGGRKLAEKYSRVLEGNRIGESWEISCHKNGMGIIRNGELKGIRLDEAIEKYGEELLGTAIYREDYRKFPLLIKILDAEDRLSVQVHPDDMYAGLHENGELGKTEMWYVISARQGAKLIYGIKSGVDRESFQSSIEQGRLEDHLQELEIAPGDVLYIPAGLVHAIGEGILIYEIQQNSDTTYRVYDWNRVDHKGMKRELHIEKALDVIDFNADQGSILTGLEVEEPGGQRMIYVACDYFAMEELRILGDMELFMDGKRFQVLTCIAGQGTIHYEGGQEDLPSGVTCLLPASLSRVSISGSCTVIRSFVPDKEENFIKPLLKRGYTRRQLDAIAGLMEG